MENHLQSKPAKVLARAQERGGIPCAEEINSSIFITDPTGWTRIDEGFGDAYALAQGNYLSGKGMAPLRDELGRCNYKLEDNALVPLTDNEKARAYPPVPPAPSASDQRTAAMMLGQARQEIQLTQQHTINAMLMLQIAQSQKGGEVNV